MKNEKIITELLGHTLYRCVEPQKICGVYALLLEGAPVYIGQSIDVLRRVEAHRLNKKFDAAYYIPCDVDGLNDLEIKLIETLNPPLNGKAKKYPRWLWHHKLSVPSK